MAQLILLNKPFQVLSQFRDDKGRATLADYIAISNMYPAGRLDYDSEGLLILTDDGQLQHRISHPRHKLAKTYWVQVEGNAEPEMLQSLRQGVILKDGPCLPAKVELMEPPDIWPRHPPIRERQTIPTCWLQMTITEGRNRQIRRMTAAVGLPTLRLIRYKIATWTISGIGSGEYQILSVHTPQHKQSARKPLRSKNRLK